MITMMLFTIRPQCDNVLNSPPSGNSCPKGSGNGGYYPHSKLFKLELVDNSQQNAEFSDTGPSATPSNIPYVLSPISEHAESPLLPGQVHSPNIKTINLSELYILKERISSILT